ncbi:metal ABC transporter permease [Texcoconibacillus texcoconensis]|uniref:Zinc transport system permease protein n=1 Tax=Texcoconibacillus texcoconensis TaxID=1095777 RepID=A0A840QRJ0_9BACI|nr:metal ABC transporter permease [Texcoconibacillus texcoconensis]MBB5173907.1 zinc transport system permease protein [Texcoconibacillus texcoconensis]
MEWLESLTFIQRGVIAGVVIGFVSPILGAFLLVRRITIISEALSHITLTGIAAGIFMSQAIAFVSFLNPLYMGFLFSLIGSLLIEKLRQWYKHFEELAIPIILSTGVGLSAILMSASGSATTEWYNYLFGSIITVSLADLSFIIITALLAIAIMSFMYKEFLVISFDQEFASVSGVPVKRMNILFSVLIALVISMAMKVVGILLVGAMITLPVAASIQIAKSFRQILLLGIVFGQVSMIGGIISSYYLNVATGGMVVVVSILLLMLAMGIKKLQHA